MQRCNQLSLKLWDAYLNSVINEQQARSINAHLLTCSVCNRTLNALETENALIGIGLRAVPLQRMSVPAGELVALYTENLPVHAGTLEPTNWRTRISSLFSSLAGRVP